MTDRACKTIQSLLALKAKDLSADERRLLEVHLVSCTPCADLARLYSKQDRLLTQTAPRVGLSTQQRARILSRLERERGWIKMQSTWATVFKSVAGVAVVVALVLILSHIFSRATGSGQVQPAGPGATSTSVPAATSAPTATRPPSTQTPSPTPIVVSARFESATDYAYGIEGFALTDPQPVVDAVSDLGLGWLKQEVRWYVVEPAKGEYEWAALDALVEACDAARIRLLLGVLHTPEWATRFQTGAIEPPRDVQDFADFVGAMAARYKGRVHAYEIWREQNMKHNWDEAPLSAEDYMRLLQAAYEAIKSADADAVVVSGGLLPTGINDGEWAIDNLTYLQQMYDAGLADYCDAVGILATGYANPPDVYYRRGDLDPKRMFDDHPSFFFRNAVEDTYAVMQANDDGDTPIWVTQFGWATVDGTDAKPSPGYTWTVDIDQAQQANYITTAYAWSRASGHVGGMFLWNLNVWPILGPDSAMSKYSIVREDWSPRPAYEAIQKMFK